MKRLAQQDKIIFNAITQELSRQHNKIELIASETEMVSLRTTLASTPSSVT